MIKNKAIELGFDLAGITHTGKLQQQVDIFRQWLEKDYHGQMQYLQRNVEKRFDPSLLLGGAKSVIVVGLNYKLDEDIKPPNIEGPVGRVARYAQYQDYHGFIKSLLRKLAEFIVTEIDEKARFKICVDSVPVAERVFAVEAGLGFIGKNHMLINPKVGPEILLGEIITTAELKYDKPVRANCGECDKCIKACPTGALSEDGWFDASKCISYLTIEHKGEIAKESAMKIDDRVFGCDECVLTCPYQHNAPVRANKNIKHYPEKSDLDLKKIINMAQSEFEKEFADSSFERCGLEQLKRNARICLKNSS